MERCAMSDAKDIKEIRTKIIGIVKKRRRTVWSIIFTIGLSFLSWLIPHFLNYEYALIISALVCFVGVLVTFFLYHIEIITETQTETIMKIQSDFLEKTQIPLIPEGVSRVTETQHPDIFESFINSATQQIIIVGSTLVKFHDRCNDLAELMNRSCKIVLITNNPLGINLNAVAEMNEDTEDKMKKDILYSLDRLSSELQDYCNDGRLSLKVTNSIIPFGVVGVDMESNECKALVSPTLFHEKSQKCPQIILENFRGTNLYDLYFDQFKKIQNHSIPYVMCSA
jgi:hypothetical protein